MRMEIDMTNANDDLKRAAEDRMNELQQRANYLTRVFCRPITVEDLIEWEKYEED